MTIKSLRLKARKWLYSSCPGFAGAFPYYDGTKVYFPKNSIIFTMACKQEVYEQANVSLLQSLVKPDSFYFDIGANIGLMAIPILNYSCSCRVVSFEPSPSVLPFLKRTVENSPYRDRWKIIEKATGSQVGFAEFFTSNSGMEAYSSFRDTHRGDTPIKLEIPVTTLDTEWNALGQPAVSVIKIDVEGAELQVLEGAIQCIEREKPCILVEWNSTNFEAYRFAPDQLLKFADSIGYQVFSVLVNFSNYPPFNILPVSDSTSLKLQMLSTESFLLAPKQ
jgi:FkbM family methyltransferase